MGASTRHFPIDGVQFVPALENVGVDGQKLAVSKYSSFNFRHQTLDISNS